MRFLTTTQLGRLYFGGSRWAANKRLRKLLDAGLVRVWVRDLAQENVYSLERAGARTLTKENGDGNAATVPRGLDGNLEHLLAINQVRISLAMNLPAVGGEILWWRSDWELRSAGRGRVIPDAIFRIRWEGVGEQTFALEIDNQTRSPQAFLKKILKYGSLGHQGRDLYGVSDFITLVVGRELKWVERYRLSLSHTRLGSRIWFTTLEAIEEQGAPRTIWKAVEGEERYSLRELASLPYGKEEVAAATPSLAES